MTNETAPKPRTSWKKRLLSWGLALVALAFVVWVVPIRDRCTVVGSPGTPAVAVSWSWDGASCVVYRPSGEQDVMAAASCAKELSCDPDGKTAHDPRGRGLASTFAHARLDLLALLVGVYFIGTLLWAARWRILLSLAGLRMSVWEAWRVTVQAQAGGILLPGGIGGDALRIGMIVGRGAPTSIVVASVFLDRIMGLVTVGSTAAALGLSLGSAGADPVVARQLTVVSFALAGLPVGFVVGLLVLRSRRVRSMKWLDPGAPGLRGKVSRTMTPVLEYVSDPKAPRAIVLGLLVSLLVTATQFVCVRGAIAALGGVPSAEKWVYVGTAIAMIVAAIPALPGGWGTSDAAYVVFLGMAGLTPGLALGVSLIYRLFWYLSGVVGAVLYLVSGTRDKAPKPAPEPPP